MEVDGSDHFPFFSWVIPAVNLPGCIPLLSLIRGVGGGEQNLQRVCVCMNMFHVQLA